MGTRGAVGFRVNQQDKVSFKAYDCYPDGLGKEVIEFIQSNSLNDIKIIANNIVMIDETVEPTPDQIKDCEPWTNLGVSEHSTADWYCLLREAQEDLNAYKNGLKYMVDSQSFLVDSLFCEYAYVIDIDEEVLEFYAGFNQKSRTRKGRYASFQSEPGSKYYGVVLLKKYPLDEILAASEEEIREIIKEMNKKVKSFRRSQENELNKKHKIAMS